MRYEIKFRFNFNQLNTFLNWFDSKKNISTAFESRKVYNIYFDDKNLTSAKNNIIGLSNRAKYRLRWYSQKDKIKNYNFEIKYKKNRLSFKKIYKLLTDQQNIEYNNIFSYEKKYFENKDLNNLCIFNKVLKPILKNNYFRKYFIYKNIVRVTLDDPCEYEEFNYERIQDYQQKFYILEIKFDPKNKDIAFELLKNFPFFNSRHSKYIHGLHILKKISFY